LRAENNELRKKLKQQRTMNANLRAKVRDL
jgi:hypothetical protein